MSKNNSLKTFSSPLFSSVTEVSCPFCNKDSFKKHLDCDGFSFVKCKCGLVYQRYMPDLTLIKDHYGEGYANYEIANEANFLDLALKGLKDVDFVNIEPNFADKSILDIGCATGALLNHFKQKGYDAQGIEIDKYSAKIAFDKYGLKIHNLPIEECNLSDESFSVVHSSHVIEHVREPKTLINEAFRVLKKGGYLAITTPNVESLQFNVFKKQWRSAISDHLVLFNANILKKMLEDAGFRVLKTKTWGGWAVGAKPVFVKKHLDILAKKLNFGDVMIILAKKD